MADESELGGVAAADDLFVVEEAFLAASIAALDPTDAGAPDRAFVAPGDPALDCCDQLTVHTQSLTELGMNAGAGANARARGLQRGDKNEALLLIEITRCVPVPTESGGKIVLPSPAAQQAAAKTISEDGWALWLGLSASLRDGPLSNICSGAVRLGALKLPPQGGCGGWIFTYQYPLGGGRLS